MMRLLSSNVMDRGMEELDRYDGIVAIRGGPQTTATRPFRQVAPALPPFASLTASEDPIPSPSHGLAQTYSRETGERAIPIPIGRLEVLPRKYGTCFPQS